MKLPFHRLIAITMAGLLAASVYAQSDEFRAGQEALAEEQYERAIEAFESAREKHESEEAAALYWEAYALMQEGRARQAEQRVRRLERDHENSPWLDDAQALLYAADGEAASDEALDEELRLYALSALMDRNPERALPLVMELVNNTDSDRIRRDAMFILGVSDDPEAQRVIARIARESDDPALRAEAIHAIGVSDSDEAEDLLRMLAEEADDPHVQHAIVEAAMIMDANDLLLEIARRTEDPAVRIQAIHALGANDAADSLRELYPSIDDADVRRAVLEAMAMADDLVGLEVVIESEPDPQLRTMAIRSIGLADTDQAAELLKRIYANPGSSADRKAVLEAVVMLDEDAGLELAMTVAENETDPALLQRAIHVLAMIEATEALRGLYGRTDDPALRVAIIHAFGLADDSEGLEMVLRTETDSELRAHAIRSMALLDDDSEQLARLLIQRYREAAPGERQAIIDAAMMRDDAKTIIELIELEPDASRKRRLVQVLAMMDDEAADEYLFQLIEKGR